MVYDDAIYKSTFTNLLYCHSTKGNKALTSASEKAPTGLNLTSINVNLHPNQIDMAITRPVVVSRHSRTSSVQRDRVHGLKERKGKEEYLYSAFHILCISQSTQAWITQFYLQIHHACLSFVCVHQMAPPLTEVRDI